MYPVTVAKSGSNITDTVKIRLAGYGKKGGCDDPNYPLSFEFSNPGKRTVAWIRFEIAAHRKGNSERLDLGAPRDPSNRAAAIYSSTTKQFFSSTWHLAAGGAYTICHEKPLLVDGAEKQDVIYTPVVADAAYL